MTDREKQGAAEGDNADAAADFVRDLATAPPPKSLETVKAASHALEMEKKDLRVRERAYELWEQAGRPEGGHEKFWLAAEAEVAGPDAAGATSDKE